MCAIWLVELLIRLMPRNDSFCSEGLEKMEREKSKQTEREKEIKDREQQLEYKKRLEKEAMQELEALKKRKALEEEKVRGRHRISSFTLLFVHYDPFPPASLRAQWRRGDGEWRKDDRSSCPSEDERR